MTDSPAEPPRLSVLQLASSGRLGGDVPEDVGPFTAPWSELPAILLSLICGAVFVGQLMGADATVLGLSAQALTEGRWYSIVTHMFAHGGLGHLVMNVGGLLSLGAVVMTRFGSGPGAWLRFMGLFFAAGLAGAALYLALHPFGVVPMVGASGAIFGLWGAAARIGPDGGIVPLISAQVRREAISVLKVNVVLFAILWVLVRMSGGVGGLAWEAHIGGFLLGLLVMPRLISASTPSLSGEPGRA